MIRGPAGRIAHVRYVLRRHKAANWVGRGRGRKSTRPGANGVVELSPFEFLDRLADLVPPPRKHRHRYHGVFAPNHPLLAWFGNPDPADMKVYCPTGKETFDDDETTEEAQSRGDRCQAA